jgi:hypothetical protein
MHNEKLVTCIKVAGKVLREQKDQVFIPFGSEYSIFIKNLNSVRALVRINLDGVDVTDGTDLVVGPNSSIDLERFMKTGNLSQGNRFKFIERTGKVEAHRGIQAEDGLLRVEFQFEKVAPRVETIITKTIHEHHHHDYWDYYWNRPWHRGGCYGGPYYNYCSTQLLGGAGQSAGINNLSVSNSVGEAQSTTFTSTSGVASGSVGSADIGAMAFNCSAPVGGSETPVKHASNILRSASVNYSAPVMDSFIPEVEANDAGITVPGSLSNQQFSVVASFPVEDEKHVIILKLLGETGKGKAIKQAVTVKHSQTCVTCGTRNRGKLAQFCRDCGTALEVA